MTEDIKVSRNAVEAGTGATLLSLGLPHGGT
jgi:hypothetical protein